MITAAPSAQDTSASSNAQAGARILDLLSSALGREVSQIVEFGLKIIQSIQTAIDEVFDQLARHPQLPALCTSFDSFLVEAKRTRWRGYIPYIYRLLQQADRSAGGSRSAEDIRSQAIIQVFLLKGFARRLGEEYAEKARLLAALKRLAESSPNETIEIAEEVHSLRYLDVLLAASLKDKRGIQIFNRLRAAVSRLIQGDDPSAQEARDLAKELAGYLPRAGGRPPQMSSLEHEMILEFLGMIGHARAYTVNWEFHKTSRNSDRRRLGFVGPADRRAQREFGHLFDPRPAARRVKRHRMALCHLNDG